MESRRKQRRGLRDLCVSTQERSGLDCNDCTYMHYTCRFCSSHTMAWSKVHPPRSRRDRLNVSLSSRIIDFCRTACSPAFHCATPSPTSTTSPADSWPEPHCSGLFGYPPPSKLDKLTSSVTIIVSPTRPCFQKCTSLLLTSSQHLDQVRTGKSGHHTYPQIPVARTWIKT